MAQFDATEIYEGLSAETIKLDCLLSACQKLDELGYTLDFRGGNGEPYYSLEHGARGTVMAEFDFGLFKLGDGKPDPKSEAGTVKVYRSHTKRGTPPIRMTFADVSRYDGLASDLGKQHKRGEKAIEKHGFSRVAASRFERELAVDTAPGKTVIIAALTGTDAVTFAYRSELAKASWTVGGGVPLTHRTVDELSSVSTTALEIELAGLVHASETQLEIANRSLAARNRREAS